MNDWKLEPLNDGLPKCFRFGKPGFLSEINMKLLRFSASALVANAAAEMTHIEGWREQASEAGETWVLTRCFSKFGIVGAMVHIVDHIAHGTMAQLESRDRLK
jgi:hypothetical protein